MNFILDNFVWMGINIVLAIIPAFFGFLALKTFQKPLKILFLFLWLLFLPNTIYVLTDLLHFPRQWMEAQGAEKTILLFQYSILEAAGLLCFILSIYFFEKMLLRSRFKKNKFFIISMIILLNFTIAFGVVLGRIQRLNSWDVFTNTEKFLNDSFNILSSNDLILLVLIFGFLGNIIYFLFKDLLVFHFSKLIKINI